MAFGEVLGWGPEGPCRWGDVGAGAEGSRRAGDRGTEGGEGAGSPCSPTTPSRLISHPAWPGLAARDAASRLVLLVPIINVGVQASGEETLPNNLPCVYSALNRNGPNPGSLDLCLFSRTSSSIMP